MGNADKPDMSKVVAHEVLEDGNWIVGFMEPGQKGYISTTYTYGPDGQALAAATAKEINKTKGHSPEYVDEVYLASLAQG